MTSSLSHSYITASFPSPPSLHPILRLTIPTTPASHLKGCDLHAFISLSDHLFLDSNELNDHWGRSPPMVNSTEPTAEQVLVPRLWNLHPPVLDLERPVRANSEGRRSKQEAVLHLVLGQNRGEEEGREMGLDVQLHTRYQEPVGEGRKVVTLGSGEGEGDVSVFAQWGCLIDRHSSDLPPQVRIYDIPYRPNPSYLSSTLEIPTGIPAHRALVEGGTTLAVLGCWLWIGWEVWRLVVRLDGRREGKEKGRGGGRG